MNGRPITFISLTTKKLYEKQMKLQNMMMMVKKERLLSNGTFFINKALLGFDVDVNLRLIIDLLTSKYYFDVTNLSLNLFK